MTVINQENLEAQKEAHKQAQGKEAPNGRTIIPDKYTIQDDEGNYIDRSRSEDKLNETLNALKVHDVEMVETFTELNKFESGKIVNSFKEEAEKIIEEVNNLKGDIYTKEGKENAIAERIKKLAESKKEEVTNTENGFKKSHAEIKRQIEKELNSYNDDSLTEIDVQKATLRNNELTGQVKGLLYKYNDTRNLEFEFKELVKKSEDDKSLGKFLESNFYLFLDKIQTLETDEQDKKRATHIILEEAEKIKTSNASPKNQAMNQLKNHVDGQSFNMYDSRVIDMQLKQYLKDY